MQNLNKHIINKVFLEINTNSKEKGYYLKDNIDAFLQKEVFALLENYFTEVDSKNPLYSIQLDKLNLDIAINQNLDFEDFKKQILKKITTQVEEIFETEEKNIEGYKLIKPQEKEIESFFHFLETGTNTWWTTLDNNFKIVEDKTINKIINEENFFFKWINAIQKPIVRTRFIKQFSDSQIANIIKKGVLLKKNSTDSRPKIISINAIQKHIETCIAKNQLIPNQRFLIWEIVLLNLLEANNTNNSIVKQKLTELILSVFEFHKKNHFLQHRELLVKEIENQIENQNELELLAHLDVIISIIEKKLDLIILKEKETELNTPSNNQVTIKTDTELKNATETENRIKIENATKAESETEIENAKKTENLTEVENDTKTESERNQENNENLSQDQSSILFKSKDATISDSDKNIETQSNKSKEEINDNHEKAIDKKDSALEKEKGKNENRFDDNDSISESYVDNAGLVLIHPFLKSLFENCRLLDKDNTINNPEVAAHLLHYVATGKEQDYENAMIFEKFLCNIPIAEPIERNIVLSEEMKKEAATMLQAVLSNWDIMKKSSAELLQNEFLQRPGKLNINGDESPVITMERKTQDVLLDKLSWNLSIIKLAWKKRIIYVNW
ncbi:contractile injection system tape measure protein [Flavobacterium sp. KACC 22763]|uniref:contractile injection system tape measure protein n=1 Tax=Flavobacterium sp. KACC 22763 TaxID=3025668 RepID=UPI0023652643|nr:contractile injection system tape measure protein [Flavobacterium sp. KACC 22763]WDF65488.1 contractile injection system tape measure protein [Flavobacterium sp. KACC 22763]